MLMQKIEEKRSTSGNEPAYIDSEENRTKDPRHLVFFGNYRLLCKHGCARLHDREVG